MADTPFPLRWQWSGEAMMPASRYWAREADKRYVVGETYTLDEIYMRSHATHAHFFACIKAAWESLPDHLLPQYPNPEALRKRALIHTGFCTQVQHVCKSAAEAERLAAIIRPYDTYQLVLIDPARPTVVTVYHALSQDHRSMDKRRFAESKEAVLRWIGDLIGADPAEIARAA